MSVSTCDPLQLDNLATCFRCYNADALAIKTYLLCQTLSIATPPCVTPTAPTSTGFKSKTDTTIRISWFQPANSGSLITSYTIKWGTVTGVYTNSATVGISPKLYTITGLTQGTQYFWVIQANSFAGCSSANSAESNTTTTGAPPTNGLLNGLISYWQIDQSTSLSADSQDGNTLTVSGGVGNATGGPLAGTGYFGTAGTGNLQINPCPVNMRLGAGKSFSLQIWFNPVGAQADGNCIVSQYSNVAATTAYNLTFLTNQARLAGWSGVTAVGVNLGTPTVGAWNHIVIGYDSANTLLFGQLNGGARITQATIGDLNLTTIAFAFATGTALPEFGGGLGQGAFWNRVLSTTDVANLYNGGAGLPFSSFQA